MNKTNNNTQLHKEYHRTLQNNNGYPRLDIPTPQSKKLNWKPGDKATTRINKGAYGKYLEVYVKNKQKGKAHQKNNLLTQTCEDIKQQTKKLQLQQQTHKEKLYTLRRIKNNAEYLIKDLNQGENQV